MDEDEALILKYSIGRIRCRIRVLDEMRSDQTGSSVVFKVIYSLLVSKPLRTRHMCVHHQHISNRINNEKVLTDVNS